VLKSKNSSFKQTPLNNPVKIVLIYFIVSALWIFFSDDLLFNFFSDVAEQKLISIFKGWAFVLVTSILIYFLIRNSFKEIMVTQKKLLESEQYSRMLFESSSMGLAVTKMDGKLVDVNPAFAKIIGRTVEETLRLTYWEITPEKYYEQEQRQLKSLSEYGYFGPYEKEYIHSDGHLVPVRLQGLIIERHGEKYIWSSVEDITERKISELALMEKEFLLAESQRIAQVGAWSLDIGEEIIQWTDETYRIYGVSPEKFIPTPNSFMELIPENNRTVMQEWIRKCISGTDAGDLEFSIIRPDGEVRILNGRGILLRGSNNEPVRVVGTVQDVTQRKQAENAIRESERRYQTLLNISPAGIFRTDLNGNTTYINPKWTEISGLSEQEALGSGWLNTVHPDDREKLISDWKEISYRQQESLAEYRIMRPDGSISWVMGQAVPELNLGNQIVGYVGTIIDLTDRKLTEDRVVQKNKQLQILSRTAKIINRKLELDSILRQLVSAALELTDSESGAAGVYIDGKIVFTEYNQDGKIIPIDYKFEEGNGVPGWIIKTKKSYITNDAENDEHVVPEIQKALGFYNLIDTPILDNSGSLLGCFEIHNTKDKRPYEQADIELLQGLAATTAIAIENAKLFEKAQEEITKSMRLSEALMAANKQFEDTLENMTDGFVVLDNNWIYRYVNSNAAKMFGRKAKDLLGKHIWTEFPEGIGQPFYNNYYKAVETRENIIFEDYYEPWDRWFENRVIPSRDGLSIFFQDITERKMYEISLRASEEKYRSIYENSSVAILLTTLDGDIISANDFACKLFQRTEDEICRIGRAGLVDLDDERLQPILEERKTTGGVKGFLKFFRKDGSTFEGEISSKVFTDGSGNKRTSMIIRDLTEQRLAEARLIESTEQMRSLAGHLQTVREEERATIAREMHDELGQILTSLKMNITFAKRELEYPELNEKTKKLFDELSSMNNTIDKAVIQVRKLITELRPELIDKLGLIAALEWYSEEFQKTSKINCAFITDLEELALDHDTDLAIFRIVQEALTNAAKHSKADSVEIYLKKRGRTVAVEVIDNGRGIREEELKGRKSFGLIGMRERATLINGRLDISPGQDWGTIVKLEIELEK